MSKWQAVVFDLDDTLYPEKDYAISGLGAVAAWVEEHIGIPARRGFDELRRLFEQGVRGNTFNRWLGAYDLASENLVLQLVRVYREHEPVLTPFPEVPGVLESLHLNFRLGLLTDGYLAVQKRKFAALGLSQCFDAIVFSDEWGRRAWKPNRLPYEVALERLDADASRTVYVADNPIKDFLGARQLGIGTIWARRPGGEYTGLEPPTDQHAPDLTLDSLRGLERSLVQLEEKIA